MKNYVFIIFVLSITATFSQTNEEKYSKFIQLADSCFAIKDYEKAKKNYETALQYKPEEVYPKHKIAELAAYQEHDKKVERFYYKADSCFIAKDFASLTVKKGNYTEEDVVNPLSVYAQSKVDAENLLLKGNYSNYSIVRTIIVYGNAHHLSRSNLFLWAKSALPKGEKMNVVDDQFRAPTWADDLAWGCIRICDLNERGIYHLSGPTTYSIYEIVERIANYYNYDVQLLNKISSSTLNQPAARPPKTGFDLTKARKNLGYQPKTIEETLDLF
ncbi:MAG: sugar nucleotide-binding protein [Crocinitomicaceae bacterium]